MFQRKATVRQPGVSSSHALTESNVTTVNTVSSDTMVRIAGAAETDRSRSKSASEDGN